MTTEPKAIKVTCFVCPGCKYSRSERAAVADHMTRCWRNPDNRACMTCAHFDRGDCCSGYECGCRGQDFWTCAAGLPVDTGVANTQCHSWVGVS